MTPLDREENAQPNRTDDPQSPTKSILLSNVAAARWLDQLGKVIAAGEQDSACLEQLRNSLEDCGWLACWKREEVIVDLCPVLLADLMETLLKISQTDQSTEQAQVIEEIIQVLAAST
jgi:hypothetical protein